MAQFPGWLLGSYSAASVNASLQRSLNIYPEVIEAGAEKVAGFFRGCPGLGTALLTLPTSPVRGLWAGGSPLWDAYPTPGGRLFAAAGSKLYEVFANGTYNLLGEIGDDATHTPVQFFPNRNQLLVISAGNAYLHNGLAVVQPLFQGTAYTDLAIDATTNTLMTSAAVPFSSVDVGTTIAITGGTGFTVQTVTILSVTGVVATSSLALGTTGSTGGTGNQSFGAVTARTGAFLDSFYVVAAPASNEFFVSAPNDGTSWDPNDVALKESYPDNIGAILADHEELYVFGEDHTEIWRSPGSDGNFPFQRDSAGAMHCGIVAPWSACSALQGVAWVGGDTRGAPVAYYAQGYIPKRISTHAIEQVWASYSTAEDATAFVYELDGHVFWQINFPTGDATWVYDFTASEQMGKPMWHERNSYDGSAFHRHRAGSHAYVFGKHYVGDFATGAIYPMASSYFTDHGQTITCQRTLPHLCQERVRQFFSRLQLDLETGGGVALTIVLDWSDDGGHNWVGGGSAFTVTTSTTKTLDRAVFWRMGSAEDRVFRITVTGNTRIALLMAYLDYQVGIS